MLYTFIYIEKLHLSLVLLFLHLLPLCLGKLLHVDHLVFLIDYLEAEHGLDDIFQRDDASQGAILVDDDGDVLFLLEEFLPDGGDILIFGEGQDGTSQFAQLHVKLVFSQLFEYYKVNVCVFGHLHNYTRPGLSYSSNGINYYLTSADYLDFQPTLIWNGELLANPDKF